MFYTCKKPTRRGNLFSICTGECLPLSEKMDLSAGYVEMILKKRGHASVCEAFEVLFPRNLRQMQPLDAFGVNVYIIYS